MRVTVAFRSLTSMVALAASLTAAAAPVQITSVPPAQYLGSPMPKAAPAQRFVGADTGRRMVTLGGEIQIHFCSTRLDSSRSRPRVLSRTSAPPQGHQQKPCHFRKSYPDVLVMQSSQDRNGDDSARSLDGSMRGRIFL